jgi:hypothetical protein
LKTILNKTREPLRVALPRGKTLHLGPGQSGQVANQHLDHKPLKRLIDAGKVEVQDAESSGGASRDRERAPHESTHGHQAPGTFQFKGER